MAKVIKARSAKPTDPIYQEGIAAYAPVPRPVPSDSGKAPKRKGSTVHQAQDPAEPQALESTDQPKP